jgi:hypothetical protein
MSPHKAFSAAHRRRAWWVELRPPPRLVGTSALGGNGWRVAAGGRLSRTGQISFGGGVPRAGILGRKERRVAPLVGRQVSTAEDRYYHVEAGTRPAPLSSCLDEWTSNDATPHASRRHPIIRRGR